VLNKALTALEMSKVEELHVKISALLSLHLSVAI